MEKLNQKGNRLLRGQQGITGLETAIVLIAFVIVGSVFAFAALTTGMFASEQAKGTILSGLGQAQGTLVLRGSIIATRHAPVVDELVIPAAANTGTLLILPVVRNSDTLTHSDATPMVRVASGPTTEYEYTIVYATGVVTLGAVVAVGQTVTVSTYTPELVDSFTFALSNAAGGDAVDLTPGQTIIRYTDSEQTILFDALGEYTLVGDIGDADGDNLVEPGELVEVTIPGLVAQMSPDLGVATSFSLDIIPPVGAILSIGRFTPGSLGRSNDLS